MSKTCGLLILTLSANLCRFCVQGSVTLSYVSIMDRHEVWVHDYLYPIHETELASTSICDRSCLCCLQEVKRSNHLQRKIKERNADRTIEQAIDDQFATGRLYACLSSRPGQCGRADGFIIEGKELEFYVRRMQRKKGKGGS